ncbi:MAG TPA: ThuA domain-containing protein [Solirubrobacteraceae bacterium]|nr:ThuA domain-containing protein [Solirubrobacteraceae bacterium]
MRSIATKVGAAVGLMSVVGITIVLLTGALAGATQRRHAGVDAVPRRDLALPAPRRILVLTETRGYHHASIPAAIAALRQFDDGDRRVALTFLAGARELTSARLHGAAAVVFLLTSGELPLSAAGKRALLAFVRDGGGLVGFHSATDTFHHWPAYLALIGAEFSHHPRPSTQRVIVEDRHTPATAALPASFQIHDEFYVFTHAPRPHVRVLARLDTGPSGPDRPLVWCRRAGKGRVFYDALGHFDTTWSDTRQLAIVAGALDWASGVVAGGDC